MYFVIFMLALIMALIYFRPYTYLNFTQEGINKQWHQPFARKKVITYSQVKGIVLCAATDSHFNRLKDRQGKPIALIALFDSACSFVSSLNSTYALIYKGDNAFDCLGTAPLNIVDLEMLLKNVAPDTYLYITTEVIQLKKEALSDILQRYSDIIIIV